MLNLQQQLKESNESYDESFRSRLSRVVVKLFVRVVKAEESVGDPYVQGRIDMEALICSLEDILTCNENSIPSEATDVTIAMINSLLQSILSVQGSATQTRGLMEDLGIDPITSALGKLLMKCDGERDDDPLPDSDIVRDSAITMAPPKMTPSKDVASLVSRLGCAPPGEEREAALASIRAYKLEYGDKELDTHLQQLSGPFREFIVEQINRNPSPIKKQMTTLTNDSASSNSDSVSDRIRNLRSRLQASEVSSPQKSLERVDEVLIQQPLGVEENKEEQTAAKSYKHETSNIAAASPSKFPALKVSTTTSNNSNQATPITSESKIPIPGSRLSRLPGASSSIPSFSASSSSAQSLRERLAARQNVTTIPQPAADDNINLNEDPMKSSSLGRAAALRARLEVVKQQSNNNKQ